MLLPLTKRDRCGFNWKDANQNCYDFCSDADDCEGARNCFTDMSFACPVKTLKRCGKNWADANVSCESFCEDDIDCYPQKCFSGVEDICQARCGTNWEEANSQCQNQCRTLESIDCPGEEKCFLNMVRNCSKDSGATTTTAKVAMTTLILFVASVLLLY